VRTKVEPEGWKTPVDPKGWKRKSVVGALGQTKVELEARKGTFISRAHLKQPLLTKVLYNLTT
jgi:hypothetical protein